jgi:hypothetical protein
MNLVDANVLLYAVNEDDDRHDEARSWLDTSLSGGARVGFAWVVLLAFVRLSTRRQLFPHPLTVSAAMDRIDDWLAQSPAVVVEPGPGHARALRRVLEDSGATGNLSTDAHLAALALERKAVIVTYDTNFARFDGLRWTRPSPARHEHRAAR